MTSPKSIALDHKLKPSQERSRDTYEAILETAGELLGEMGFEQLTTNLICKRASLTPPALYRYFPNKYAILRALGDRLMQAQDELIYRWVDDGGLSPGPVEEMVASAAELQARVVEATRAFPGGLGILRALRAVPILHQLRLESRDAVADPFLQSMRTTLPAWPDHPLRPIMRLMIELQNAATEMIVEEGDAVPGVASEAARMFILYFNDLSKQAPTA